MSIGGTAQVPNMLDYDYPEKWASSPHRTPPIDASTPTPLQARMAMLQQIHSMLQRTSNPETLQPHASHVLSLLTACLTDATHPPSCLLAIDCLCAMTNIMGKSFAPYTGYWFLLFYCCVVVLLPTNTSLSLRTHTPHTPHRTTCAAVLERQGDVDPAIQQRAAVCMQAISRAVGVTAAIQGMMAGVLHLNASIREHTLGHIVNVRGCGVFMGLCCLQVLMLFVHVYVVLQCV